jgi:hypothetical protein
MFYVLIIVVIGAVGFVLFSLFSSSRSNAGGFDGMGGGEQGPAPIHQELATLKDSAQKAEMNYSMIQKELEVERKTKSTLEEELNSLKTTFDKLKSECDLFKVENASLKGKLVERDRDNRKMIDELKILREKSQAPLKPAATPAGPAKDTPIPPATPAPAAKPPETKPFSESAPSKPSPIASKPVSIPNAEPEDLVILTEDFPPKEIEKAIEKKPEPAIEPAKNPEPENKPANFKLVGEDEDDDKTKENKDIQNP